MGFGWVPNPGGDPTRRVGWPGRSPLPAWLLLIVVVWSVLVFVGARAFFAPVVGEGTERVPTPGDTIGGEK